jgi:DNA-binding transcriptional LysR family regulator
VELGVRLFHRTTREVRLTGAGHAFLLAARRVLSEAARARAEVSDAADSPRGQIRLGATQTASGSLDLAGLLGEFRRLFPEVTVVITAGPRGELVTAVADGDLDVALAAEGDLAPAGTRFQPLLADEPLLAVVAPDDPLARRKRVSLAEIAGQEPCVEFRPGTELRRHVDAAFRSAGLSRTVAFELGQLTEMVRFAQGGPGDRHRAPVVHGRAGGATPSRRRRPRPGRRRDGHHHRRVQPVRGSPAGRPRAPRCRLPPR